MTKMQKPKKEENQNAEMRVEQMGAKQVVPECESVLFHIERA